MNAKFAQTETLKLNRRIGLRAALTPLAMALGFMLSNPALADGKEYPGTMCEEYDILNGMPRKPEGNIVFTGEGEALNISKDRGSLIICPLVRDGERHQGAILYAAVSVYKPNTEASVVCSLRSQRYFGGSGWIQNGRDNSDNTGLRLIEFPVQADSFTSGTYTIGCFLPPAVAGHSGQTATKSGIAHYGIVEAD